MVTATLCSDLLDRFWIHSGPSLEYAIEHVRSNIDIERIVEKARNS
jgi:hypothetical protein